MLRTNKPECWTKPAFEANINKIGKWKKIAGVQWLIIGLFISMMVGFHAWGATEVVKWEWSVSEEESPSISQIVILEEEVPEEIQQWEKLITELSGWMGNSFGNMNWTNVNWNDTLNESFDQLVDQLGENATWEDIEEGLSNGTLTEIFMRTWLRNLMDAYISNLPSEWDNPIYIIGTYRGKVAISDWAFNIILTVNTTTINLIQSNKSQLLQNEFVAIPLNFGQVIKGIFNATIDIFVDYMITDLLNGNATEDVMNDWWKNVFEVIPLSLGIRGSQTVGLYPLMFDLFISIQDIMAMGEDTFGGETI